MKKFIAIALIALVAFTVFAQGSSETSAPVKIGIPDDATNGARGIKLLETAGLIKVDPAAGYACELKDITEYIYNIEIVPQTANTLPSTLDDYAAATINGTYATSAGLIPSKDAVLIEKQDESGNNPYVNIIVARSADKDNPVYKTICDAIQSELVAEYMIAKYKEAYFPAFNYTDGEVDAATVLDLVDNYKADKSGKKVVKIGVCGSQNQWVTAAQLILDKNNAGIYIQLVEFDAYNLPNEALNSGDIDLNAFQHKAYLNKEIASQGYKIEAIADTLIAPLSLYTKKASDLEGLKALIGKKN